MCSTSPRTTTTTPASQDALGVTLNQRPSDPARIERLRGLCLALPAVSEKLSHGEPSWFVKGKQFATTADHHHDDRLSVWCAAPIGTQEMLVSADPQRFFRPPYVGSRGWLGIYLDVEVDWDELAAMIQRAYRQVAPKRLLSELDHARGDAFSSPSES